MRSKETTLDTAIAPLPILDPSRVRELERARKARDPRFDGRFYVGVTSTGIYCRPVCPAPLAKRRNVRYFETAAAAAESGLRPCLRCRPEEAPGRPLADDGLVREGLRMVESGVLDRSDGGQELARRLGWSERQVRRRFVQELGATPRQIAATRRLHFARRLLRETSMRVVDIGFAAGFASLRRFNQAFVDAYGRAPRDFRKGQEETTSGLQLRLSVRPPFAWGELLAYLQPRAIPGVEVIETERYRRAFAVEGLRGQLEVRHDARTQRLLVALDWDKRPATLPPLLPLVDRLRAQFDLDADPVGIAADLVHDPDLAWRLERRPGVRVPGCWDPFELLVRIILGQQVSVRGATTLAGRVVERWGEKIAGEPSGPLRLFPTAERLRRAQVERIGMPAQRGEAVRAAAAASADGLFESGLQHQELVAELLRLPGIGPWTAQLVAMRVLRDPDAFPAGDLGLRKALDIDGGLMPDRELEKRSESWRPWRSYAAMLLWLEPEKGRSSDGPAR